MDVHPTPRLVASESFIGQMQEFSCVVAQRALHATFRLAASGTAVAQLIEVYSLRFHIVVTILCVKLMGTGWMGIQITFLFARNQHVAPLCASPEL